MECKSKKEDDQDGTKSSRADDGRNFTAAPHRSRTAPGVCPVGSDVPGLRSREQANHYRGRNQRMGNIPGENAGRDEDGELTRNGDY